MRCRGCGLRRTWPVPDPDLLAELYDADEYYVERAMGDDGPGGWTDRAREVLAVLDAPRPAVLDVGAGNGGLVAGLRSLGVDADGVEPSESGRRRALQRGVALHAGIGDLPEQRYGAVTMLHVLEHVADPVEMLTELRERLLPGGRLLVEVPNATSVDALWPPLREQILDLPFHLHHFSPATLARVVERAGLRPLAVRRFNPAALEWALARRRGTAGTDDAGAPAGDEAPPATGTAGAWHRLLPHVRRALPGMKLQLLASA